MENNGVLAVIPVFNEEDSIAYTIESLKNIKKVRYYT